MKKRGISLASNELIRIQKIIADAGIASRRKAGAYTKRLGKGKRKNSNSW